MRIESNVTGTVRSHLTENLKLKPAEQQEIVKRPNLLFQPIRPEKGRSEQVVHKFTIRDLNNARIIRLHGLADTRPPESLEDVLAKKLREITRDDKLRVVFNGIGKNGAEYEVIHPAEDPFEARMKARMQFKACSMEQSLAGLETARPPLHERIPEHTEIESKIRKFLIENLGLAALTHQQAQNIIFEPRVRNGHGEPIVTHDVVVNNIDDTLYAKSPEFDPDINPKELKEILQDELDKIAHSANVDVRLDHQGTKSADLKIQHVEPSSRARKKH